MKYTSFYRAWMQRSFIALALMLTFSSAVKAQTFTTPQAPFWTIFGAPSTGCNQTNRMNCALAPSGSSFTAANTPVDRVLCSGTGPLCYSNYLQNSVYDAAGDLMFTVNMDGIYGPSGSQIYPFSQTEIYPYCPAGASSTIGAGSAISEIVIVPYPCKPGSYYVLFWCAMPGDIDVDLGGTGFFFPAVALRAVEVDVNTVSYSTTAPSVSNDWVLGNCSSGAFPFYDWGTYLGGNAFEIVADAANAIKRKTAIA